MNYAMLTQDESYLRTLTVLYVEDDSVTMMLCSQFLQRAVGTLITADNGAEGFDKFLEHSPDIIVTDILMPVMDGLAMAAKIKAVNKNVPIIVLTAFEQIDYLMRAINIGIDRYVTKPVDVRMLMDTLLKTARNLRAEEQLSLKQKWELADVSLKNQKLQDALNIIFEFSPTGIILADPCGLITYTNKRTTEMLGYPIEELLGNHYLELIHADDLESSTEKQQLLLAGTIRNIEDELIFVRKDGTFIKTRITVSLYEAENGLVCLITEVAG